MAKADGEIAVSPDKAHEIATYIAREIFYCGSDPGFEATRIEFKSDLTPTGLKAAPERSGGGFGQKPLADFIASRLRLLEEQ